MFATSTQRHNWVFSDEAEINKLKQEVNAAFIEKHGDEIPVSMSYIR